MANFIGRQVVDIFNTTINGLREDIGRNVIVVGPKITIDCPNCNFDEIKQTSGGKFDPDNPYPSGEVGPNNLVGPQDFNTAGLLRCPVCDGRGRIESASNRTPVLALITILTDEKAQRTPLGKKYSRNYELSTTIDSKELFEKAVSVIIDGHPCTVESVVPDGIKDTTQLLVHAGG